MYWNYCSARHSEKATAQCGATAERHARPRHRTTPLHVPPPPPGKGDTWGTPERAAALESGAAIRKMALYLKGELWLILIDLKLD